MKASVRIGKTLDASSFQQARHKNSPDRSQGYKENAKETEVSTALFSIIQRNCPT